MWSLLCLPPLVAMIVSDLRSRRIGMLPLIVFGIVLLAVSLVEFEWRQVAINVVFNLLTLSLLILAHKSWSIKHRFYDEY